MSQQKDLGAATVFDAEPGSSQNPAVARFTQGSWERGSVVTFGDDDQLRDSLTDAVVYAGDPEEPETEIRIEGPNALADASLIAAAPEMHAALTFIFERIADKERQPRDLYPAFGLDARRAIEMAQAALRKARGEG